MKKNIIFAAFAAASALLLVSSCAKEQLRENISAGDGKVFSAVINQDLTKTTITDEYKVNWDQGDLIDISGGATYSATPDASDATKATFTKVSGLDPTPDYIAVYPASIFKNGRHELPATQTYAAGKFNAPMCAMSSTESLEFKNFCGVLCFALKGTDKVKSIAVTANEQICGPFEFADATSFSFTEENKGYTITLDCGEGVQLTSTDSTNFYISLPPATYTAGMKIVITNTEGKTIEKITTKSATIARNQIYIFNWTASFSPAEPEYVVIAGLKWATKNLGAENVTDYGDYFAWGETEPYYEGTGGWPATPAWKSEKGNGYAWQSYCGSSSFSEWSTPPYDATTNILEHEFDAAAQILGDGWHMPTSAEFQALYDACGGTSTPKKGGSTSTTQKGVYWCNNYDGVNGVNGLLFCDGTNRLFFPAAGSGLGAGLNFAGSGGYYWSSSLNSGNPDFAYYLGFGSGEVLPQGYNYRCRGFSVRPVKDAAAPLPAGALAGEFSVAEGKQVHFSQGNLWYGKVGDAQTATFNFEANQYSSASSWEASHVSHFYWSKDVDEAVKQDFNWEQSMSADDVFFTNETETTSKDGFTINVGGTEQTGWRTLSTEEWQYLFNDRTDAASKVGFATVGGVHGIIILPDTFTDPMKNNGSGAFVPKSSTRWDKNVYTSEDNWNAMETAGAVFLPAAGYRDGSSVDDVGGGGLCWSSTAYDEDYAYGVGFDGDDVYRDGYDYRNRGYSVRLITESN